MDNAILNDPTPKHEAPFHQGQGKQLRFIDYIQGPMQFLNVMLITMVTSTATNLVHRPAKSSLCWPIYLPGGEVGIVIPIVWKGTSIQVVYFSSHGTISQRYRNYN